MKLTKIDTSSPRNFKRSLEKRAAEIKDTDFVSMHDMSPQGGDGIPPSGKWGGVVICVGVAQKNGVVAVRNTNDPEKTTALFSRREWEVFIDGVKAGKFD